MILRSHNFTESLVQVFRKIDFAPLLFVLFSYVYYYAPLFVEFLLEIDSSMTETSRPIILELWNCRFISGSEWIIMRCHVGKYIVTKNNNNMRKAMSFP